MNVHSFESVLEMMLSISVSNEIKSFENGYGDATGIQSSHRAIEQYAY